MLPTFLSSHETSSVMFLVTILKWCSKWINVVRKVQITDRQGWKTCIGVILRWNLKISAKQSITQTKASTGRFLFTSKIWMRSQRFTNLKLLWCASVCDGPHLQTTLNPPGSPHSISQTPNADRHGALMTDMEEEREKTRARLRKRVHHTYNQISQHLQI